MRFKSEKNVTQRKQKSGLYTFLVRVKTDEGTISRSFNESDYPSARSAFEAAINFRDRIQYESRMGLIQRKNSATVREMFDEYISSCPSSLNTKQHLAKLFNKYVSFKDKKVQELTKANILSDLNKMVEVAQDDTIQRVFFIYKTCIVGTALLNEILIRDTTLGISKPKSKMRVLKKDVKTSREILDEVKKGIIGAVSDPYDARIINYLLEVIYYTGMRPAEAEVLTKEDIKGTHIRVDKQLGSSGEEMNVVTRCKTLDSVRNIPINASLQPILDELLGYAKGEKLFVRSNGEYMNSTWVGNIIRRVCKNKGIEFNLYRLRHNVATELITKNVDDRTTMEILGHTHYNMSLYYASSNDELKENAIGLIH